MEVANLVRVKSKIIVAVLVVGIVGGLFWAVFYASFLANVPQIIPIRSTYFNQLYKWGSLGSFYYVLRPTAILPSEGNTRYKYIWMGRVERIDYRENVMVAKDKNGKEWKFRYTTSPNPNFPDYNLLMFSEQTVGRDKAVSSKVKYMAIDTIVPEATEPYFIQGDIIWIFWGDERTVREINQSQKRGEVIELKGAGVLPITHLVVEEGE